MHLLTCGELLDAYAEATGRPAHPDHDGLSWIVKLHALSGGDVYDVAAELVCVIVRVQAFELDNEVFAVAAARLFLGCNGRFLLPHPLVDERSEAEIRLMSRQALAKQLRALCVPLASDLRRAMLA